MTMEQNVDTLEQDNLDNQNTNTDDLDTSNDGNSVNDNVNYDVDVDDNQEQSQEVDESDNSSDEDEDEDRITKEALDAMSDDEFTEFMNSGKLPDTKAEVKPIEKKETPTDKEQPVDDKKKEKTATKETTPKQEVKEEDLKAIHAAIFKPFKANGKEIAPKTVEDVISLMQMGANYTKKMQLMAPMKKAVESLNKASIGEDDLNFLIDVHKGDKEAIKKLLKKHEVDPLDLDMESTNYVPKNNIASDEDVEFTDVIQDIQSSLPKIQEILSKQWDNKSKDLLLKDPMLMKALHEEIEMGRFDEVQNRLETERTFGRYKGKSDIEAYIDVVTKMVAEQAKSTETKPNKASQDSKGTTKPIPDKTKAAPVRTKGGNQGSTLTVKDLLSMPEEEFNKLSARDLV